MSAVRLPKSVLRVVKPGPAPVTVCEEPPAAKIRSCGLLVAAEPLSIAGPLPAAAAEASSGLTASTPEYSWM